MNRNALIGPLNAGFRRIFFKKTEDGESLSIVKLVLFTVYLLANILTYLQFAMLTQPVPQLRFGVDVTEATILTYQIPMTSYGKVAHYLGFFIIIGFIYFFITQDKPLSVCMYQLRDWVSQSLLHWIGFIGAIIVGMVCVLQLRPLLQFGLSTLTTGMSYYFGLIMTLIWWVIQPILFLGGSLLLVDTLSQTEKFQNRFGTLTKPRRKTIELFVLDLILVAVIFILAATVFKITLDTAEPELGIVTRVTGIDFYKSSIYRLLDILSTILGFTIINLLILGIVYGWKRSRALMAVILGSLFVGLYLMIVIGANSVATSEEELLVILIFGFVAILVFLYFTRILIKYILKRSQEVAYLDSRIAILPWILFIAIFQAVLKTFPVLLAPIGRLTTLANWLDVVGLLFSLIFGVIRVTTIMERPKLIEERPPSRNPLKWVQRIQFPAYTKVLALFYLAFIGFYLMMETQTIAATLSIPNDFRTSKQEILTVTSAIGFIWVFWRYKPLSRTTVDSIEID